jgi:hypothetical protein
VGEGKVRGIMDIIECQICLLSVLSQSSWQQKFVLTAIFGTITAFIPQPTDKIDF